jgi:hypothetical protein
MRQLVPDATTAPGDTVSTRNVDGTLIVTKQVKADPPVQSLAVEAKFQALFSDVDHSKKLVITPQAEAFGFDAEIAFRKDLMEVLSDHPKGQRRPWNNVSKATPHGLGVSSPQ